MSKIISLSVDDEFAGELEGLMDRFRLQKSQSFYEGRRPLRLPT